MTVTGIITAIVVGIIIGALGRLVVPGKQNIPIWLTIVVGIVAALLGTAIARGLGVADTRGFDWIELIVQIVLAAIGVVIAAIGCYKGFHAQGGARGVGVATTQTVVVASIAVFMLDYVLTAILLHGHHARL